MKAQKPLKISEKCNDQTPNHAHLKKKTWFTSPSFDPSRKQW